MSSNKFASLAVEHEANKNFWMVLAVALFFAGVSHAYWYRHFQPDDAFIYLVYVKSFFNGLGLTFNGEVVEGYSSVLWTLLVTLFSWSGADPLVVSKCLGLASYLALAIMLVKAHRMTRSSSYGSLFSLAVYFSVPSLAMWAAGAMETLLFSALIAVAAGLYYYARLICSLSVFFALSGFAFALVALTRPEGFALIGAVFAFDIILALHGKRFNWRGALVTVIVYSVLTALMFFVRFLVYGKWFPATVGAKTGSLSAQMHNGLAYLSGYMQEHILLVVAYGLSLVYVALVVRKRNFEQYLLVWMLAILVFGYLAFNWLVGGDWMIGWRFVTPIVPFAVLTIGLALAGVKSWISVPSALVLVASLVLQGLDLNSASVRQANSDKGDILMGQYIQGLNLAPDSKIAVIDAGAIPYYAGLPTIDMIGLNDSYLSSLSGGFMQKFDNDYVLSNKPSVIQFHTRHIDEMGWVAPTPVFLGATLLFYSQEFQRWYAWDENSPIPHLFLRRNVPLAKTFMDTFYEARLGGEYQRDELKLKLEKSGDGVWIAPSSEHIESGAVYVRVRFFGENGQVLHEKMLPIPKSMIRGDVVELSIDTPDFDRALYRISACPVLVGVREMEPCLNGQGYEYVVMSDSPELALGGHRFNDKRLMLFGWSDPESEHVWSLGQDSIVKFSLKNAEAVRRLSLQLIPFGEQRLVIELNGIEIYRGELSTSGQVMLSVAGRLQQKNELRLLHPDAKQVGEHDRRVVAFALQGLSLE